LTNHKEQTKISQNKTNAALSAISSLYFDAFTKPVQLFLPHSSACSGKWNFWDSIDFFVFKEKLQNKEFNFNFREKIMKSEVWNTKFDLKIFPMIVQRRLIKEKLLDKKLNPDNFKYYIDSFRYACPIHSGWSIGLERFTMALLKLDNIREACIWPRDRDRLVP